MGPDYAHAEARKSPALDGKVERDSEGKEVRYPVMLSAMEKLVARKVCLAFKVSPGEAANEVRCVLRHFFETLTSYGSKLSVALISSEPTDTPTSVTSTASVL